jgi:flavorubredoxin/NADPH-dependent 2,4-dienoyl-CoA reductase/sulfur reductase-like enzyme
MKSLQLSQNLWWIGSLDPDLRAFDIIMETEFGTTYNSYVLKGSEKTAIIDTAKLKTYDQYIAKLSEVVDVKDIDYIIVNHTEPDHAGSIGKLIQQNPDITIVGTQTALTFLKDIVNAPFNSIAVKENDTLSLGDRTLRFMILPNLHWPDTMYTFVEEDGVLFTCDSFGAHFCDENVLLSKVTDRVGYERSLKYYYDMILDPFPKHMLKALERIKNLDIKLIATGHGPVLDQEIPEIQAKYRVWATHVNPNPRKTVIIPYVSAYGYTKEMAMKVKEGLEATNELDVRMYDMEQTPIKTVVDEIYNADGILIGTPTILAETPKPLWDLLSNLYPPVHGGKFASAFGAFGWSGEGVPHMLERLKQLRMKMSDGLSLRFKPNEEKQKQAYDWGFTFGQRVLGKDKVKVEKPVIRAWKCIVCGEVILSPERPAICPVCGAPAEQFVEIPYTEITYSSESRESILVLGNGGAAVNAVEAIRLRNKVCDIEIVGEEDQLAYNRPMLTKEFFGDFKKDEFLLKPEKWYRENNITLTLGTKAVKLNAENKEVVFDNGEVRGYDRLIIATGADCFVPPITGAQRDNVVKIRHLQDVAKIKELIKTTKRALVIGGGILGLEAAWQMKRAGLEVVVFEMLPALMLRQLDETTSEKLRSWTEGKGIEIHTNVQIKEITGEGSLADGILLGDGRKFDGELIIISAGVRANVELAKNAGITINRAIVVDEHMETNIKGIYAAGDCAEFNGFNWAIWPQAVDMGKVAGANIVGDTVNYTPILPAVSVHAMDTDLFAIGDCGKDPNKTYRTLESNDLAKPSYAKYFFSDNKFVGGVIFHDVSKGIFLTEALMNNYSYADFLKEEPKH